MSEPFLAEMRMVGFNFPPRGWALCDGQVLPINQNQSLYALLGTTYGGDGRTDFALPDMRGRMPVHRDAGHALGSKTMSGDHTVAATDVVDSLTVERGLASRSNSAALYSGGATEVLAAPYCAVNFCIALQGLFPSRS